MESASIRIIFTNSVVREFPGIVSLSYKESHIRIETKENERHFVYMIPWRNILYTCEPITKSSIDWKHFIGEDET